MVSASELRRMKETRWEEMCAEAVTDLRAIQVSGATLEARLNHFLSQIGNPYHYRVGDTKVSVSFSDDGESLRDKLYRYFVSLKSE